MGKPSELDEDLYTHGGVFATKESSVQYPGTSAAPLEVVHEITWDPRLLSPKHVSMTFTDSAQSQLTTKI